MLDYQWNKKQATREKKKEQRQQQEKKGETKKACKINKEPEQKEGKEASTQLLLRAEYQVFGRCRLNEDIYQRELTVNWNLMRETIERNRLPLALDSYFSAVDSTPYAISIPNRVNSVQIHIRSTKTSNQP